MNFPAITYLVITIFILITVAVFAAMDFPFSWIFYLTVFGHFFSILSL